MTDAEHMIENALFLYRKMMLSGGQDFSSVIQSDSLLKEQMSNCEISTDVLADIVSYVYHDVLRYEEDRMDYFNETNKT